MTRTARRRYARGIARSLDMLLFIPALLYVLTEHVLWAGARALLRGLGAVALVQAAQAWLGLLPPLAALPVFLVPEVFSHASELWAAVLLARGHLLAAGLMAVLGKGLATIVLVWIYHACEPALLRVRWFARAHDAALRWRAGLLARTDPWRRAAAVRLARARLGPGAIVRRFLRWRGRLGQRLEPGLLWLRRWR
ncbi:MAG: hypothetical protein ACP5NP_01975 [Acetobacteraceae bacterium]